MKKSIAYGVLFLLLASFSFAAVGDIVHQLNASAFTFPGYTNFCSVGLAFDGSNLYYDRCSDSNIYKVDPINGSLLSTFDTVNLTPNAMAFDSTRNGIWFGVQSCIFDELLEVSHMPIYFWNFSDNTTKLMFTVPSTLINPATNESFVNLCFLDGLAFNANGPGEADDELWFSDDINRNLGLFRPVGIFVGGFDAMATNENLSTLSGLAIGGPNLYMANDGGGKVYRANSTTLALLDLFASAEERLEDMECDPNTFTPTEVMWVRHTPQGVAADDLITAFEIEPGTCGLGGVGPGPFCGDGLVNQASEQCDDGNNVNGDGCSAICEIEQIEPKSLPGRMTGGGSIFNASGTRVTHGFELHCNASKVPNNLQVNWAGNRFHLETLTSALCTDDLNITPQPPTAGFDTYKGVGTGRYNGVLGAIIEWLFTDAGEPGKNDFATITIKNINNSVVLNASGNLNRGNHQAHKK